MWKQIVWDEFYDVEMMCSGFGTTALANMSPNLLLIFALDDEEQYCLGFEGC